MKELWRPQLFSAIGAGFTKDTYLNNGIHCRWWIDPTLGIPHRWDKIEKGYYQVIPLSREVPCLAKVNLSKMKKNPNYPVHSSGNLGNTTGLEEITPNEIRFLRDLPADISLAVTRFNRVKQFDISDEHQKFIDYLEHVFSNLASKPSAFYPDKEVAEACAVDIKFKKERFSIFTSGIDPVTSSAFPSFSQKTESSEKPFAWVEAYDSQEQLIAKDWVGVRSSTSSSPLPLPPKLNYKLTAKIRAAGIHTIKVVPVKGMPQLIRQEVCWVLCEEYLNAPIWQSPSRIKKILFETDPGIYSATKMKNDFYAPFTKTVDSQLAADIITADMVANPEIVPLWEMENTFQQYQHAIAFNASIGIGGSANSEISIPVLSSLLQAAMDPVAAHILGMYEYLPVKANEADYKVVAISPYFSPANLNSLGKELSEILGPFGAAGIVSDFLGLFDPSQSGPNVPYNGVQPLGGLIICPEVSTKPLLEKPSPILTKVTTIDLPSNENNGAVRLFVDVKSSVPAYPFSLFPYKKAIAFETHRNLAGSGFINPLLDNATAFSAVSILPPGFVPRSEDDNKELTIKDNFSLPITQEESVQYRFRAFDWFGRPSPWGEGNKEPILLPCHSPATVANLSSRIFREGDNYFVEMFAAVDEADAPLSAERQQLEIAIHRFSPSATGILEEITWANAVAGRRLVVSTPSGVYPDTTTLTTDCVQMSWNGGQLNWQAAAGSTCSAHFPATHAPTLTEDVNPSGSQVSANFKTYRAVLYVGSINSLPPGDYRWVTRVRMKGVCPNGNQLFSRESCTSSRLEVIAPPPPVVQPILAQVPLSTYADKLGDAYYNVNFADFIPTNNVPPNLTYNLYRINLDKLTDDQETIVADGTMVVGGESRLLEIAKAKRTYYEKLNQEPFEYNNSQPHFPVKVKGDLEAYHVVGIIGCDERLQENPWETAAITLFKTPLPLPPPRLHFVGGISKRSTAAVVNTISVRASFAQSLAHPPKVQIMRVDLNTQQQQFVGETIGHLRNPAEEEVIYDFTLDDQHPTSWRRYRYTATLVVYSDRYGGSYLKSDQTVAGELLTTGTYAQNPFKNSNDATVQNSAAGRIIQFDFQPGDFNISLSKIKQDGTVSKWTGKISNGKLQAPSEFAQTFDSNTQLYQLTFLDEETLVSDFALRLSLGQRFVWSKQQTL